MILAHAHHGTAGDPDLAGLVAAAACAPAVAAYAAAAARLRRRGDAWSRWRDASFASGGTALGWAAAGPLPGGPFTAHVVQHLIVGMAAPLLFVLARPLTLVLRVLPPGAGRRGLLTLAHSPGVSLLLFPPLAALIDIGGLWLLHRTGLFAAVRHLPWPHALVQAHVLAAGLLFTFSVTQLDPVRRRWSPALRGATLLGAGAAHAVLAKSLYATAPPGTAFTAADLRTGAQVMYYGGDLVEVALAVVLAGSWYAATGRAWARRHRAGPRAGRGTAVAAPREATRHTGTAGRPVGAVPPNGLRR